MPHVITAPCAQTSRATCKTACVEACPVDAIHGPGKPPHSLQLFIDPELCICCAACEPICPTGAIFDEPDVPAEHADAIELNAAFFR